MSTETCCDLHKPDCCDPEDCAPCCSACPACPQHICGGCVWPGNCRCFDPAPSKATES